MTASKAPTPSSKKSRPAGKTVLRREILGARRPSNYFWAAITAIGGTGFFLADI